MSLDLASAARVGTFDVVSIYDTDVVRPVEPSPPSPRDGEPEEDFTARAEAFRDGELAEFKAAMQMWQRSMKTARESQDWSSVLKPDATPTVFVCRQIAGRQWEVYRRVSESMGVLERASTLLRTALVAIRGPWAPGWKMPTSVPHMVVDPITGARVHSGLGKVAPIDLIETFYTVLRDGELAEDVINDIGVQILNHRMRAPGN